MFVTMLSDLAVFWLYATLILFFFTLHYNNELSDALDTQKHNVVEFYLYPTVGTVLIHSAKPELTE